MQFNELIFNEGGGDCVCPIQAKKYFNLILREFRLLILTNDKFNYEIKTSKEMFDNIIEEVDKINLK